MTGRSFVVGAPMAAVWFGGAAVVTLSEKVR